MWAHIAHGGAAAEHSRVKDTIQTLDRVLHSTRKRTWPNASWRGMVDP